MAEDTGEKSSYGVKLVRGPFVKLPTHPLAVEGAADLPELGHECLR